MISPSLQEAIQEFQTAQRKENIPRGTIQQYRHVLNRLQARYPGRKFAGIHTQELNDFLYGPAGILVGKKPKTGTCYRSALNSFFAYGYMRGWSRSPLVAPRKVFRSRQARTRHDGLPTRLPESALLLMLERAEHPMLRAMIAVCIGTALRVSDVRKLRCSDVDMDTGELYVWVMKTGRFDAMPITLDLEDELRRYLLWYTRETGQTLKDEGFLFPGWSRRNHSGTGYVYYVPDPVRQCSYSWASERLKVVFEASGVHVEKGEAWHVIRRSVARIYFDRRRTEVSHDHALRETSAFLGHLNQETTERYLGLQAEREARNRNLRGRRFIGVAPDATVTPIRRPV
ncbi:tyrosine-type recombinase/integrase [Streptomyces sp. NPDC048211]|uniref:tyrosine-type recombinase/integrase n=1 Tax=Streptomyces sp. NPDC048211 TaxID=3365516 RepID=UPI00371B0B7C